MHACLSQVLVGGCLYKAEMILHSNKELSKLRLQSLEISSQLPVDDDARRRKISVELEYSLASLATRAVRAYGTVWGLCVRTRLCKRTALGSPSVPYGIFWHTSALILPRTIAQLSIKVYSIQLLETVSDTFWNNFDIFVVLVKQNWLLRIKW